MTSFFKKLTSAALMTSVAMPMAGLGAVGITLAAAPKAEAAVIIGNRNKIKERPRRNYKSITRIERDLEGQASEFSVTGNIQFFAPDGTEGPVRNYALEPNEMSTIAMENPTFVGQPSGNTNVLSGKIEGGSCGGTTFDLDVSLDPNQPTLFTICETGETSISGRAFTTEGGKLRAIFTVPSEIKARTELYGRILIKGQPIEFDDRTVYTGDINEVDSAALEGFTFQQTITVTDSSGTVLDTQTVRGAVGEDETIEIDPDFGNDGMGPNMAGTAAVIIGNRNRLKQKPRRNYKSVASTTGGKEDIKFYATIDVSYVPANGQNDQRETGPNITLDAPTSTRVNYLIPADKNPLAEGGPDANILIETQQGASEHFVLGNVYDGIFREGIVYTDTGLEGAEPSRIGLRQRPDGSLRVVLDVPPTAFDQGFSADGLTVSVNDAPADFRNVKRNFAADLDGVEPGALDGFGYIQTVTLRETETDRVLDTQRVFGVVGATGSERELSGLTQIRLKANKANRAVMSGTFARTCRLDDEVIIESTIDNTTENESTLLCGKTDHLRVNITDVTSQEILLETLVDLTASQRNFDGNVAFEDPIALSENPDEAIFSIGMALVNGEETGEFFEIQDVPVWRTFDGITYRVAETPSGRTVGAAFILRDGETLPLLSISVEGDGVEEITAIAIDDIMNVGDGSAETVERDFIIPLSHEYIDFRIRGGSKNFGTSETQIIDYTITGPGTAVSGQIEGTDYQPLSQNVKTRDGSFGDVPLIDDDSGALIAGKGSGTKRSTSSARSRPQLQ